ARDAKRAGAERLADGKPDEARARIVARDEEENTEHEDELDRNEEHPDAHPGLERYGVDRKRFAAQRREGRPRVRERVNPATEPGDRRGPRDPNEAEEEDDEDAIEGELLNEPEVDDNDRADEDLEEGDEPHLRDEVRLACFVDELADIAHRLVDGSVLQ